MSISLQHIKKLPDSPGVYFFKKGREVLYIGKATSLRDRVRSYLSPKLFLTRSALIADMVVLADTITFQKTDSVLEALLLEAELIKKYQPHHNTREKDNKSHLYVVITDEDFPILTTVRKRDLDDMKIRDVINIKHEFGPFSNSTSLREALKIIRRIFPYRDEKCIAGSGNPCFNYQIGLEPGCCVNAITKKEYARTIRNIALFFKGKKGELVRKLTAEMKAYAKAQHFEEANVLKHQLFALQHIHDVSLIKQENLKEIGSKPNFRIEAYDIAHMQGSSMTGVMVVVEDGIAKKSDYRMFKIKRKGINDIASLEEIITRRLKHPEWPMPDIVVTDGGMPQYKVAERTMSGMGIVPMPDIVGVVKNEKHQPERLIGNEDLIKIHKKSVLLANAEAHRFTLKYHRTLRSKNMFGR